MGFSLSGSVISQSSTDTTNTIISGLSGLGSGNITVLASGASSTPRRRTIIFIQNLRIDWTGTASHDPDLLQIVYADNCLDLTHRITGTYNYGVKSTVNGVNHYSKSVGLVFTKASPPLWNYTVTGGFLIASGGTFVGRGGIVVFPGAIGKLGAFDIEETVFFNSNESLSAAPLWQSFNDSSNRAVNIVADGSPSGAGTIFVMEGQPPNPFSLILRNGELSISQYNTGRTILDLDSRSNISALDLTNDSNGGTTRTLVVNSANGSGLRVGPLSTVVADSARTNYLVELYRRCRFNITSSIAFSGIGYYRDTNNGNRKSSGAYNFTADRTGIITITSGSSSTFDLLTAVYYRYQSVTGQGTFDTAENRVDRRGKTDSQGVRNQLDPFDFYIAGYRHEILLIGDYTTAGLQTLAIAGRAFVDTSIIQTNTTTVAAYTGYAINTGTNTITFTDSSLDGARAYDYWKLWKVNNFSSEYPTISTLVCTKDGTTLDFGSINLVINGVTWASHATVTKVKTTGTITVSGGGDYAVVLEDSSGTRYRPLITVSNFPNSSKVTIIYGGTPIDVATTNAPYSFRFPNATPATVTVQVEKTGYKAFSQDVPLALADVTVFAVLIALTDADAINSPDVNFRRSFVNDSAVLAIMKAANGDASLQDYLGRAAVFDFDVLAWKNDWNAIAGAISGTTPTLTDVNRWRAYATDSGYAIVFLDNGEVV